MTLSEQRYSKSVMYHALVIWTRTQYIYNTIVAAQKQKPPKARKTVAMSFRFTPEFREQLIAAAAYEHRSQAGFLETLVRNFCTDTGLISGAPGPMRKRTALGRGK